MIENLQNEVGEFSKHTSDGFKGIKPETDTKLNDAKSFMDSVFNEESDNHLPKADKKDTTEKSDEAHLKPNDTIEENGYTFKTDDHGRVISAEGKLQIRDHEGRKELTATRDEVAHGKMDANDDRGHLIADRFNGPGSLTNLVPMDGKLNKGDYAKLENDLANEVNLGADVRLKVEPVYSNDSYRPTEFRVSYSIDGEKDTVVFKNGGGENNDKQ